jgi:hypothetical protein
MDQISIGLEPARAFLVELGGLLPKLLIALVIVVAGWLLAKLVRFAMLRVLKAVNFSVLTERAGIDAFLKRGGVRTDTAAVLGLLAYWLIILTTLMAAFGSLGLTQVTDLVGQVVQFIPRVFVAILVLAFGTYFARFLASSVTTYFRNIGVEDGDVLGRVTLYAVIVFVVVIALDQLSIGGDIIRHSFLILLAGVVLALALAFGLGGQKWAATLIERMGSRRSARDKNKA